MNNKTCPECGGQLIEKHDKMYDRRLPHTKKNGTHIVLFDCQKCVKVYSEKDLRTYEDDMSEEERLGFYQDSDGELVC